MSPESDFSTPVEFVRVGFDRIMNGTDIPEAVKERLYPLYEKAHRSGDSRKAEAVFRDCITENFRWPWLEKFRGQFEKLSLEPYM